jgi:hypothetical protein
VCGQEYSAVPHFLEYGSAPFGKFECDPVDLAGVAGGVLRGLLKLAEPEQDFAYVARQVGEH